MDNKFVDKQLYDLIIQTWPLDTPYIDCASIPANFSSVSLDGIFDLEKLAAAIIQYLGYKSSCT